MTDAALVIVRAVVAIWLLLGLGACSSGVARSAAQHDAAARTLDSQHRYDEALREREAAEAARSEIVGATPRDGEVPPALTPYKQ